MNSTNTSHRLYARRAAALLVLLSGLSAFPVRAQAPVPAADGAAVEQFDTSKSTWIQQAEFIRDPETDPPTGLLILRFNDKTSSYADVPVALWEQFKQTDSLGRFFGTHIRGHYKRQDGLPLRAVHDEPLEPPVPALAQCAFNEDCEPVILNLLRGARSNILVAAYAFTRPRIGHELTKAAARGVSVKVKIDSRQAEYKAASNLVAYLEKHDIPVQRIDTPGDYAAMHNKFMVIDDRYVITGSYNYTTTAQVSNWENILWVDAPPIAARYHRAWKAIRSR